MASEKQNTMRSQVIEASPMEPPTTGAIREIWNGEVVTGFECEMAGDVMVSKRRYKSKFKRCMLVFDANLTNAAPYACEVVPTSIVPGRIESDDRRGRGKRKRKHTRKYNQGVQTG